METTTKPQQPCPMCGHWHNRAACDLCGYMRQDVRRAFEDAIMRKHPVMRVAAAQEARPESAPTPGNVRIVDLMREDAAECCIAGQECKEHSLELVTRGTRDGVEIPVPEEE